MTGYSPNPHLNDSSTDRRNQPTTTYLSTESINFRTKYQRETETYVNVPVSSNMITASETVVLVTPAKVAVAPIIAHIPGKTQVCPKGAASDPRFARQT
jgi:hypothetical protein